MDTPPGTSDEHLSIAQYMLASKIDGAIIVTSPQEISLLDVRKEINFCRKLQIPIIGIVENMSWLVNFRYSWSTIFLCNLIVINLNCPVLIYEFRFVCPKCSEKSEIFPPTTGGAKQMADDMKLPFLGQVPLDHRLAQACDEGSDFFELHFKSATASALIDVVDGKGLISFQFLFSFLVSFLRGDLLLLPFNLHLIFISAIKLQLEHLKSNN